MPVLNAIQMGQTKRSFIIFFVIILVGYIKVRFDAKTVQ